jgi:hypothetical protein
MRLANESNDESFVMLIYKLANVIRVDLSNFNTFHNNVSELDLSPKIRVINIVFSPLTITL